METSPEFDIFMGLFQGFMLAILLVVPFWVTFKKAGLSPWHSLWLFVPFFGFFISLAMLGLSSWKLEERGAQ